MDLTNSEIINEKYRKFFDNNKYIPQFFDSYNAIEVKDFSPSLTTKCGMLGGSSNVLVSSSDEIESVKNE